MKNLDGYLVRVTFLDHCSTIGGIADPIQCIVWGVCVKSTKNSICIASWLSDSGVDDNTDAHTILRSTITSIKTYAKELGDK